MKRAFLALATSAALLVAGTVAAQAPADGQKVLRYAFEIAETSFDPAKVNDLYSRTITPNIFEGLYKFDLFARPVKLRPLTAAGMPQHTDDYTSWPIRIGPGIY